MTQPLPALRGDRYQVQALLGQGGMGVVYAALDRTCGQVVALKCLSQERLTTKRQLDRAMALFEHEYHALSQLKHPHIIEAYDYGRDELGPYYSMEYVTGETLRARTPVPWQSACSIMRDVVSALALLHSRSLVHRDLSPLNVFCSPDRPTKLIDFGAMMSSGVAQHIVGTPTFTAPEALQQQRLDGRADLYSVGACLYYAISGQHAYPASSFEALRGAWRTAPPPLAAIVPGVPSALEQLVHGLLSLDRSQRPRTAADVYERLTVIAGLGRTEAHGTAQAYLTMPKLIGREAQVSELGRAARAALSGQGGSLHVRAARGLGRSRLLDAAVLEAKLAGLRVARADAASSQAATLGVGRRLLSGLALEDAPLQSQLRELGVDETEARELDSAERERMLRELSQALFAACARGACALVVDDVHAIDEASRAFVANLAAQVTEHSLLLVTSSEEHAQLTVGSAAALLVKWSQPLVLAPFAQDESRALIVSTLGEIPNSDMLTVLAHTHCHGNPQQLMEALRLLVEQRLLRYAGGGWSISSASAALSVSFEQLHALAQRIPQLSVDARELLEVVAFDEHGILDLASYPALLSHGETARMHRALSELLDGAWAALHEDRVVLASDGLRSELIVAVSPERGRELYGRLAEHAAAVGLPAIYEAYYRLCADQPGAALAAMERFSAFADQHPQAQVLRHPITLSVTDAISQLSDFPGAHPALRARYTTLAVLNASTYRGLPEYAAARVKLALRLIAPFSGQADYLALCDLPPEQRLAEALTRAAQRCALPGVGGLDVLAALRGQTRLCIAAALSAYFMCDPGLLDAIPDLSPYFPLNPALRVAAQAVDALAKLTRGQTWLAWDALRAANQALAGPAADQIDPITRFTLRGLVLGYLSALCADHAAASAAEVIDEYEQYMPDNAEIQRSRLYLMQGNLDAAAAARRRFELLSVRLGSMSDARIVDLLPSLTFYTLCDDGAGLRRTQLALQEIADARSGWQPRATIAEAQLLRCQGQMQAGLEVIEQLMAELPADASDLALAAATHVQLLLAARRLSDALLSGRAYLRRLRLLSAPGLRVQLVLCQVCAALGEHVEAEEHFDEALAQLEARQITGVLSGVAYEIGARIALARGDRAQAQLRILRCAEQFGVGGHPELVGRYHALQRELQSTVVAVTGAVQDVGGTTTQSDQTTRVEE